MFLTTNNLQSDSMNILITGGTGFIGRQLIERLLAEGHQVTVLTRQPARSNHAHPSISYVGLNDLSAMSTTGTFDIVINLAGAPIIGPRWTAARKATLMQSRVGTTQALVDWLHRAEHKPKLFISGSAIGYYGIQAVGDDRGLDETAPSQAIFMSTLCQAWEAAARAAEQDGITVTCVRLGVVLGKANALPMMLLPIKLGVGGRLGRGTQWLSWIHIEDAVSALMHLVSRFDTPDMLAPTYNLVSPQPVQQIEFAQVAAHVHHRPALLPTPAWPMKILLGEQADLLLEGQRVLPQQLLSEGFAFKYADLQGALLNLR